MFRIVSNGREIRRGPLSTMRTIIDRAMKAGAIVQRWNGGGWETDSVSYVRARMN